MEVKTIVVHASCTASALTMFCSFRFRRKVRYHNGPVASGAAEV